MDFLLAPLVGIIVSGAILLLVLVLIAISKPEDNDDDVKARELDKPTALLQVSNDLAEVTLLSSDFENPSSIGAKEYAEVLDRKMQEQGMIGAYEKDGAVVVNPHPKPLYFEVVCETHSELQNRREEKNEKE